MSRAGLARGRGGFTLLEVLLALVLFSTSVAVLTAAYLNIMEGLAAVRLDREFDQEVRWVREQVLTQSDLDTLEEGVEATTPTEAKLSWTAGVESAGYVDLFTITLHVEMAAAKAKLRTCDEKLTVLRPSWSEPTERSKLLEDTKSKIEERRRKRGIVAEKRS